MKNTQSKLLLALTMCFTLATAHADDNKDKHSNKDTSGKSTNVQAPDSCSSVVIPSECGLVQQTTCTSTNGASPITKAQNDKDTERHKDDGKDRGDGKDHTEKSHSGNTSHTSRDANKDDRDERYGKPYGYHWEQDNDDGHGHHTKQRKVTICHRDGGARTTIDVDDDGRYHGHDDDMLDTEGACEDQDDHTGKHTDTKNAGRNVVRIHKDATCGSPRSYQHRDDGKHHQEREHAGDKSDPSSKYSTRDTSKDDKDDKGVATDLTKHRAGYRWEHTQTIGGKVYKQTKVVICHRMGNARVTLDVDDDGYFHGHDKHPMDTEGRCEDQDDSTGKHTDTPNSGKKQVRLASEPSCGSTLTTPPAATPDAASCLTKISGCNNLGVSCKMIAARPGRGGVRNVRQ
jgi:hypothetical protein